MSEGAFREDLYHRLAGTTIHLPPLRERADDIPTLTNLFLRQVGASYGAENCSVDDDAMRWLVGLDWPGASAPRGEPTVFMRGLASLPLRRDAEGAERDAATR